MNFDLNQSLGSYKGDDIISGNLSLQGRDNIQSGNETGESRCNADPEIECTSIETSNGEDGGLEGQYTGGDTCGSKSLADEGLTSVEELKISVEKQLEVGCFVDSLDDVHLLYNEYGRLMGFSVRKGTQEYFKGTFEPRMKVFHCSCDGPPDNKASSGRTAAYKKQSYRSNCKAKLRVIRPDEESGWKVSSFTKQHNHDLVKPSESYLLRSFRQLSQPKKNLIMGMKSSGIGVSRAFRFLENEAGSRQNLGFTRKDVYNELDRDNRNMLKVDNADANRLLEYLTERGMSDPSFYWKVKLCDDGRLKNLLFRDTRCLIDYQHFGDVLSVDATYKTNKYDLICVPLVGINHHRTNVMFAIAFLSNENAESYEWLFRTFLESMYHKEPSIIFSDQDQALMNGVDYVFKQSSHRLCQWHINKNATRHFGKLNEDKDFKDKWFKCMNGCENGSQFETMWSNMIEQHNLADNKWFSTMYNLRKRWSSAFTREKFSGGLHATSRSELTNKVLKELCKSTSTLHDFVVGFERLQRNWRTREFEEDALNRGRPGMFVQHSSILVQVGEIVTRNIFKLFEYEALNTICADLTQDRVDLNNEMLEFKVSSRTSITGFRVVKFNQVTKFGTCSCYMWESEGVMCRHLFRVYLSLNLHKIPDEMIINRWRKDSKERIGMSACVNDAVGSNNFSNMVFVNYNTKVVYDMLTECKDNRICRGAINDHIRKMVVAVKTLRLQSTADVDAHAAGSSSPIGFKEPLVRPIGNPISMKKRPRRMRLNNEWQGEATDGPNTCNPTRHDEDICETLTGTQLHEDNLDRFTVD